MISVANNMKPLSWRNKYLGKFMQCSQKNKQFDEHYVATWMTAVLQNTIYSFQTWILTIILDINPQQKVIIPEYYIRQSPKYLALFGIEFNNAFKRSSSFSSLFATDGYNLMKTKIWCHCFILPPNHPPCASLLLCKLNHHPGNLLILFTRMNHWNITNPNVRYELEWELELWT